MSIKVTIHNYTFPIGFHYNGWFVRLEKRIKLFKDIAVEAYFTPPSKPDLTYWNNIVPNTAISNIMRIGLYPSSVTLKDIEYYRNIASQYINSINYPLARSYRFSANGGLLDRFLGQNISATKKVVDMVTNYMDRNLPKLEDFSKITYYMHIKKLNVNSHILLSVENILGLRF